MKYSQQNDTNEHRKTASQVKPGTQALAKGLSVLKSIADAKRPLRFNELAELGPTPKASLHRTLQTLIDYGMLRLNTVDQTYRLGPELFEMAHSVWGSFDLRESAQPELYRLRQLAQESVYLAELDGRSAIIIDQLDFNRPLRLGQRVGARMELHASALGKVLLAHTEPRLLHDFFLDADLASLTSHTITNKKALKKHFDLIAARGYATSIQEHYEGVNAIAAPILNHQGLPVGAISISGASFRFDEETMHALARELIESARRISGNIGESLMSIKVTRRPISLPTPSLTCAIPTDAFLGEAPLWLTEKHELAWLDILKPAVHFSSPTSETSQSVELSEMATSIVQRMDGGFVLTTQSGFSTLDTEEGLLEEFAAPDTDMAGKRFNDGKCDSRGRLWAGTLAIDAARGKGSLFCLNPDGSVDEKEKNLDISNGLGWSPDDTTFYLTDSGKRVIYKYDFDAERGEIENRRIFYQHINDGSTPDGLAIDAEGYLWTAIWDGWKVMRLDPNGSIERTIDLPIPRPTSCAFGGPDLQTLFVTSARIRLAATQLAEAPESGSVFSLEAPVQGMRCYSYAG